MPIVYQKSQPKVQQAGPPVISVQEHFLAGETDIGGGNGSGGRGRGRKFARMMPAILVTLGSVLLANVIWPILSYQIFVSPTLQDRSLVTPVAENSAGGLKTSGNIAGASTSIVPEAQAAGEASSIPEPPTILTQDLDYTNLSSWFPSQQIPQVAPAEAKTYTIDIPTLNVEKAIVKIGGLDLDKNLIQYPGTADPGELGSPVIFGHSVSPLFYFPSISNPRRYTSIFTRIMDLKNNDKIIVTSDNITYVYRVTGRLEVKPDDTEILQQNYDGRQLKLVTCTPPGTMLRRGIVFAALDDVSTQ